MQRVVVQFIRVTQFHDPSQIHNGDPVTYMLDDTQVMGDKHIGQVIFLLQTVKQVQHLGLDRYVQGGNRLIADDQLGIQGKGAGNIDTLPLAA